MATMAGAARGVAANEGDWAAAARRIIEGTNRDDRLEGTDRADRINGLDGNDRIEGEDGDDVLRGGGGDDRLEGDDGSDTLFGGAGADRLRGDEGDDALTGGAGADLFVFDGDGDGRDQITDFTRADTIRFSVDRDDSGPREFSDLVFTETGTGTQISYGDDFDTILLIGVERADISESQFVFG